MQTPNSEINSGMKISIAPLDVEPSNDEVADIILLDSSDANMDTFTEIPLDFDYTSSSIETIESVEYPSRIDTATLPMLTDMAEETVYGSELIEEALRVEQEANREDERDISNILMETVISDSNNTIDSETFALDATNNLYLDDDTNDVGTFCLNDEICQIENFTIGDSTNGIFIADSLPDVAADTEVSNLITVSNNTNLVSGILESTAVNSIPSAEAELVTTNMTNKYQMNMSNVIQISSVNNKKMLKPITIQNTRVPICIAPSNVNKRTASNSVGLAGSNIVTKVIVSQGKSGKPVLITNSPTKPKSIRLLPNNNSTSSPVKQITLSQAKQMGINLPPIRPSTSKPQKIVLANITPGAQVLKKVQSVLKPSTPTKILPAPLVSKSTPGSQPQNIILRPEGYVVKGGTIISKQAAGQMIAISAASDNNSPKKQVQYIKLVNNNVGSTNMPTVTTAIPTTKGKIAAVTQNSNSMKIDKDTPIIVASSNLASAGLSSKGANATHTSKAGTSANANVLPVASSSSAKSTLGQRLILPAVTKAEPGPSQPLSTDTKKVKSSGNSVMFADEILEKRKGELLSKSKEDSRITELLRINQEREEIISETRVAAPPQPPKSPPRPETTGNGLKSRKPCNCTRSQCLKLYCECFANGEFCNNCNCVSCHNNISHEENRQSAIRSCLDRNPQAFRPKIGKCLMGVSDRRHTKGCHCKRSGCLKNYCECYEAQIPCSENCKCVGCKNIDDMLFATSCSTNSNSCDTNSTQPFEFQTFTKNKLTAEINDAVGQGGVGNPRQAFSFIKDQVVEATCQCLLAQAEDIKRRNISVEDGKKYILEEFGRCLIQIIECAPDKCTPIS